MNIREVRGVKYFDELRGYMLPVRQMPMPRLNRKSVVQRGPKDYYLVPREEGAVEDLADAHTWLSFNNYLDLLDDPNTQRLIFDARQAAQFDDLIGEGAQPGRDLREAVRVPFNQLYVEFSEPIFIGEGEPGHNDMLRAFLYQTDETTLKMPDVRKLPLDEAEREAAMATLPDIELPVAQVTMFLTETHPPDPNCKDVGKKTYVDRSFKMSLEAGVPFVPVDSINRGDDQSEVPDVLDRTTHEVRKMKGDEVVAVGWGGKAEDKPRYLGWYERTVQRYCDLITYIFAYTSAKSMRIIEAPLTRQERRWHHRNNKPPRPWHVIEVDPKFYRPGDNDEEGEGRKHGYRYDVIGHFRAGRYKIKDGTHRAIISWVPPHQRGLANSLYIPATHVVKGGKNISPLMQQVYGHAEELGVPLPDDAAVSIVEEA